MHHMFCFSFAFYFFGSLGSFFFSNIKSSAFGQKPANCTFNLWVEEGLLCASWPEEHERSLSVHRRHVDFDSQSADGVLTEHRDVLQHFGVQLFLTLFGSEPLFVPSLLLAVHLGEQVDLDGAQCGCQDVKPALQEVAERGTHTEAGPHQVGHRFAHHAHGLQEVQRPFLGKGLTLVDVAMGGWALLGMVEQVSGAVGEVGGSTAQREQGQVQVTSGFGESMEEQPQLKHGIAWR